jgi:hypothetical protein
MKNKSQSIIELLYIGLFVIGCSHKPTVNVSNTDNQIADEDPLIVYELAGIDELSTVKLSEIGAIDIKYIPLKTNSLNMIPPINNIIFCDSYFLTYSYTSVNIFRYDGSFITDVGTIGRGPNEYTGVSDVEINPQNESIYITSGEKFLVYNKKGKFLRTFKNPQKADRMNFKFTEDGILCYYFNDFGNINFSCILFDTAGTIIKKYPNRYPWKRKVPGVFYQGENIFYKFNNQLFRKEIYCDTIFSFKNKVFIPHIVIAVGKQRLTPEIRSSFSTRPDFSVTTYQNYITPWNLLEFGDFIYYEMSMTLNGSHNIYCFIGSKKNNYREITVQEQGMTNDLDGGPCFLPRTSRNDNIIVSWIEALKFKDFIASDEFQESTPKYPEKKKELEILANSLKETDNPVLMLVRLKK